MAIFNSHVQLPEGKLIFSPVTFRPEKVRNLKALLCSSLRLAASWTEGSVQMPRQTRRGNLAEEIRQLVGNIPSSSSSSSPSSSSSSSSINQSIKQSINQSNQIKSNQIKSNPVQSNPIQSINQSINQSIIILIP